MPVVLGDVLGAVAGPGVDGALGEIELLVLSELLGALLELDDADELCTPSAAKVCGSRLAVVVRPLDCWKLFNAAWVLGPILPSIAPVLNPLSFSAC